MRQKKGNLAGDHATITRVFVAEAARILSPKLYGIYMYGASVFEDGGPVQDIDCHVVLKEGLVDAEREDTFSLHNKLARDYPPLGGELDAYFVLLDAAKGARPPQHQLDLRVFDHSWALHCAHVRAGRYQTLYGPEPTEIFPAPSWADVAGALQVELAYVKAHCHYPAYCVLNLCRILSSYADRNPVKSKHGSGLWASEQFPEWKPLIRAAIRYYGHESMQEDDRLLGEQLSGFLVFAVGRITGILDEDAPNAALVEMP